jgi:hypothetical protein
VPGSLTFGDPTKLASWEPSLPRCPTPDQDAAGLLARDGGGNRTWPGWSATGGWPKAFPGSPWGGCGSSSGRRPSGVADGSSSADRLSPSSTTCPAGGTVSAEPTWPGARGEAGGLVIDREVGAARTCSSLPSGAEGLVEPQEGPALLGRGRWSRAWQRLGSHGTHPVEFAAHTQGKSKRAVDLGSAHPPS